jgi:CO/xanthine dehydrogenase FAD-binding subunit
VESIATGPGRTSLSPGEFIVEFHLPKPPPRSADAYLRFIPRTEMDIAVVGAAVSLTLDAGAVCADARVVLGAVAPTAILVPEAAAALVGASSTRRRSPGLIRRRGAPASRSTTSAGRSNTGPKSPACWHAGRRRSPMSARGSVDEQASRIDHH